MPLSAASVYFMIGTCYTELNDLVSALDAYNNAIKVNPGDAEVRLSLVLLYIQIIHLNIIG